MKYIEFDEGRPLDLILLGRITIDFNPAYNDQVKEEFKPLKNVHMFEKFVGGSPANIAVGVTRYGLKPGLYDTPHSVQFQNLTKQLLLICSDCGAISGMTAQSIDHYSRLALFHDVGKQAIPPAILDKPGPLTPEEFAVMKTHTVEGCRLLAEDPALSAREDFSLICDVCRHHHERWDGGGYPDGLSGCRIAPWVQAVGLADAFDALLHPRPYKPAYLWTQAASMIMDGACGAFDPDILLCFRWGVGRIYAAVYENTLY